MGQEPSGSFVTSLLELKLDPNTTFEWQKFSQDPESVPHYTKLLEFLDLQARASKTCRDEEDHTQRNTPHQEASNQQNHCILHYERLRNSLVQV